MRTADVVELESTDCCLGDVPLAAFVVVIQVYGLRRVGQVDHKTSVRPCAECHRALLNTRRMNVRGTQ